MKKIQQAIGGIGNNQGHVTEEYFYNSLKSKMKLGGISFDLITANVRKEKGKAKAEYDIIMENGSSVAIIEVKYKAHLNDLEKLKNEKLKNFYEFFPLYKDFKIYLGLGGFHINEDVVTKAEEYGFFILKRKGDVVEQDTKFMRPQEIA